VCKNNVISVTVPNVTGVPNVTSAPNVPKMPKNHFVCQKCTKKSLGVLIGVVYQLVYQTSQSPKCTKTHQGLCPACKNSVTSVTVPNVIGVPNVTSNPNVQKMTKNHFVCQKCSKKQLGSREGLRLWFGLQREECLLCCTSIRTTSRQCIPTP